MANVSPNEQPTPAHLQEVFQTEEILWFNDGRWGLCGYAIPNSQGKTWTLNSELYHVHKLLGEMLFHLAHRESVRFKLPPHKDFWWDWHKALISARANLIANRLDPGTSRNILEGHVSSNKKTFLTYPVPYFGERVRQEDIRFQIELALVLLGELMQHSANEQSYYISGSLVDVAVGYVNEMLKKVAVKYFGYSGAEVAAKGSTFVIDADRFSEANYRPQDLIPSTEMSTERPTQLWWPTENDLSAIRGIQYTDALYFAQRYPVSHLAGEGDWESTLPGIVNRVQGGEPAVPASNAPSGDNVSGERPPA